MEVAIAVRLATAIAQKDSVTIRTWTPRRPALRRRARAVGANEPDYPSLGDLEREGVHRGHEPAA